MSDLQQPSVPPVPPPGYAPPSPQAPAPSYPASYPAPTYAPAPGYQATPSSQPAPTYQAPPGALQGPAAGYAAPLPASAEPRGSTLGVIALVLAVIAGVGCTVLGGWASFEIGRGIVNANDLSAFDESSLRFLSPVRDIVLWAEIAFWAGTIAGITGLVLGIIAAVKKRGRGAGIAAIVIAALGPILFVVLAVTLFGAGAASGAAGLQA
ncbi:hypothetical protein GCM10025768_15220 [Microbacterium pseudoresistens]|uniref:Putative nucleic acid-binding protein n=1 Tax=Microbacterium pseudoresistens TaxID=640634 RepID=A0A7Y9JLA5_9MICO|nr:hypothetical protein [Microbacterium pseudoresistens]NYD53125.1 putative nucleic acid-binding protein [Microbacterium pseudoresistens]